MKLSTGVEKKFLAQLEITEFQLGTPLHTWGQFYRHLLMTQDTSGNICFS